MREPTEMEQRCLRAALAAHLSEESAVDGILLDWWMVSVRAVIRAMREPTPGMVDVGAKIEGPFTTARWQAMIDAASPPDDAAVK